MDAVIAECARRKIYVLLDRHRPTSKGQTELWHGDGVSEETWIKDWVTLATRSCCISDSEMLLFVNV